MNNPRVAIVTGGSRGIGREVVARLAAEGHRVVVSYAGNHLAAEEAVADVVRAGGQAVAIAGDVADEKAMAAVFDLADSVYGGVDVVVHAAGRMTLSPLVELDLAELDSLYRTNVRGAFVVARLAALRVRTGGAIITFSTSVIALRRPGYSAYAAGKAAVETLTQILAQEMRGRDITVNAVAPGPTATELFLDGKDEQTIAALTAQPPLERLGTPGDIAGAVAFLAGPSGRWVNGQVVRVNGGIV
ncbi:SDR family oxidoreductase [Streptomyces albipurpureus]|uniref:SDR family oxidoreductase n=1 Tax=Streptomyces albipurpureus TaxID=2897419 RepID=A0ABT0UIE9_9ACTN|nr:SDR family oxidoreductase [Streptomyces sp. CWNU-1]MCM2388423.1 SDR family oxidoreductase [Streptomyces sp. CWNU-1]